MTTALIVDDDAFMRMLTSTLLTQLGLTDQRQASDGEEALTALREGGIAVMLCDLNMPGMDGISLLRHVAQLEEPPAILLFSGEDRRVLATAEQLAAAHKLTVLGAVSKPPTLESLEPMMRTLAEMERADARPAPASSPQEKLTPEEIQDGLSRGQLTMAFQPQVATPGGAVVGAEALARWEHPTRGLLGPWAFIGVAEQAGLIGELTEQALELSVQQAAAWHHAGRDMTVSVNVTVDDLADVAFADYVLTCIDTHGLPPNKLVLEVTESKIMRDVAAPLEVLTRLRMRRIGLALDDYGTGASSMEQLARIPFTELKVDRQFVANALTDDDARAMLESAVSLASRLELTALAEGVETEEEWKLVTDMGCTRIQGYLVAPPLTVDRFEDWTEQWNAQIGVDATT